MVEPLLLALLSVGAPVLLPEEVAGWRAEGPAQSYDARTIFDYIDGHGEVFLAYGMKACLARRYLGPPGEGDILLDVFDMGSPSDAYGVFSHTREGEPVDAGREGWRTSGTLGFWKGRTFASVTAERPNERSRAAALALARAVAAPLDATGDPPGLVRLADRPGLVPRSAVYLRSPQILDAHVELGAGDPLGLGSGARAVVARFAQAGAKAQLVVVEHPSAEAASAARLAFAKRFAAGGSLQERPDGWWGVAAWSDRRPLGAFVVRSSSRELAEALLAPPTREGGEK